MELKLSPFVIVNTVKDKIGPQGKIVTETPEDLDLLRDTLKQVYKDLEVEWTEKAVRSTLDCVSLTDDMYEARFQNGTTIYFRSARFRALAPNWTPGTEQLKEEVKAGDDQ